jgi:hypothetical protein
MICPNIFVDQGQFSDPDFISGTHQMEKNVKCDEKFKYSVLKALTDIITNISAHPIGLAEILVIMSVSTFNIVVILYRVDY